MNEFDLLGPLAYGEALGTAVLKATAEDFQVDEVLDIPLSGDGEHLWLWVEKRGLNTEEAARRLAKAAGVPLRTVSYAGLKDRQALTRQWFSVQLPGKADPDLSGAENDTLKILKTSRHKRKLQRGAHAANGFTLRLTQLNADKDALEQRLQLIAKQGVPNYFGSQRFGWQGGNLGEARDYAARKALPEQRNVRSRLLSTARSYLFNQVLAARVACAGAAEPWLPEFVRQVFRANFADDLDIATTDVISLCLERVGVSANDKIERALAPANQSLLRSQTERAAAMGVFGAPTFIVGQELFWGNDRLEQALAWCESPSLGRSA